MTLPSRSRHQPSDRSADLSTVPTDAWFTTWIAGVLFPLVVFGYGLFGVTTRHAKLLNLRYFKHSASVESPWLEFDGREGVLIGFIAIFVALAIHVHWFWSAHPKLVHFYDPLRYLASLLASVMLFAFCVFLMMW